MCAATKKNGRPRLHSTWSCWMVWTGFHLVADVIGRVPTLGSHTAYLKTGPTRQTDRAQAIHRQPRREHAGNQELEMGPAKSHRMTHASLLHRLSGTRVKKKVSTPKGCIVALAMNTEPVKHCLIQGSSGYG